MSPARPIDRADAGRVVAFVPSVAFATFAGAPELTADDELLARRLTERGVQVAARPWNEQTVWSAFDAVVVRSTWDFHRRPDEFHAWIAGVADAGVRLINPAPLLHWNVSKTYLRDLAALGVRTVPTRWVPPLGDALSPTLQSLIAETNWTSGLVIKPVISASAFNTWHLASGTATHDEESRFTAALGVAPAGLMVQPFLRAIQTAGEWSLIFVGGTFSHAVLKFPRVGDFRVQRDFGGTAIAATPCPALIADAERVLRSAAARVDLSPADVAYARIDGVEIEGRLVLMEFEAMEPVLFLAADVGAPDRLAQAIERIIHGGD